MLYNNLQQHLSEQQSPKCGSSVVIERLGVINPTAGERQKPAHMRFHLITTRLHLCFQANISV